MIRWALRQGQTRTGVQSIHTQQMQRRRAHAGALRCMAAVQMASQLLLWITFRGYDQSAQAVWQAALLQLVPLAGLWLLWRAGEDALSRHPAVLLPLAVCLVPDAAFVLYALCGFIDWMIPEYPYAAGAVAGAAVCWLAVLLGRRSGAAYGTSALKIPLLLAFLLGTVFLNASNRADRLWPLLAKGFDHTALAALEGAGSVWGAALLFALPGKTMQRAGMRTSLWAWAAWAAGALWALWYGFLRPWAPGDALDVGQRLMGLARHAGSVVNYNLAGLMWMVLLPLSLSGCIASGEMILRRVWPRVPRTLAAGAVVLPGLLAVLTIPSQLPGILTGLMPWRAAVSLVCGGLCCILARKEAKR